MIGFAKIINSSVQKLEFTIAYTQCRYINHYYYGSINKIGFYDYFTLIGLIIKNKLHCCANRTSAIFSIKVKAYCESLSTRKNVDYTPQFVKKYKIITCNQLILGNTKYLLSCMF